jgi:dihydrofolate synthase/folylpolyglutamate synthase
MTYQETLDFLFNALPMYQRIGAVAFKADLRNTLQLCEHLGNPHQKFKSIHVGGTNGKGSTSHALASVLQEAGYKVGLYTSPHLKSFTERIKINGCEISEENVIAFVAKNKTFLEELQPSFFEMTVGMAFNHFVEEIVDYAVIEVGLGGEAGQYQCSSSRTLCHYQYRFGSRAVSGKFPSPNCNRKSRNN